MGKYGWNKNLSMTCLANSAMTRVFCCSIALVLKWAAQAYRSDPLATIWGQLKEVEVDGKGISLNNREFVCTDLAVSSYQPEKGMKDDLFEAIDTLTPVDPNPAQE